MKRKTSAMRLHLDNRPRNVQRSSRLLTALLILAILPLWPTLSLAGVEAVLTDDAYTSSSSPAKRFGKKKGLLVSKSLRSFLKFNLSTLPSGAIAADVEKATLKLFVSKRRRAGSFDVFAVTGPWSEQRITHRTAPVLADHAETGAPVSVGGVNQFVMVDVTTLVQDWVDFIATSGASGRANNGVALVSHSRLSAEIDSKESDSTAHDAALEIVLAGGVGSAGPIGPAGAVGLQGTAGPTGPAGPTGDTGPAGLNGPAGPRGFTGFTGAVGPAGPAGPQGLAWQGNFSSSTNYNLNDAVHFADDGSSYLCVNALGCAASLSPAGNSSWGLVVEGGETGATGPQGDGGAQGPIGLTGAAGSDGAQGPIGLTGAAGSDGVQGPIGLTGAAGPQGPQGATGSQGPIGVTGATGASGATGDTGAAGPTGPAGPPGVSALELLTATSASDSTTPKTQTVSCPGGKKALGGGGSIVSGADNNLAIQASQPSGGSPPTVWSVTGVETDAVASNWSVTAYVICATVP